tara:strand:+ start:5831 stop:6013 length:183 start_codon:yes stop_codon:yes gene_type:complete
MAQSDTTHRLLVEDDASKFFDLCPVESLRPEYGENGLPNVPDSFTLEEIEAAFSGFSPTL